MKRIPELDGLRGLAVLIVMGAHAHGINLTRFSLPGGNLGVDIFFVLSGFLITSLLLREKEKTGSVDLRAFYTRRALRLLPAVTVLCIAFAIYFSLKGEANERILKVALAVQLYMVNWSLAFDWGIKFGPVGHTWSLSIEEQFYLLWPAILLFASRSGSARKRLVPVIVTAIIGVAVWRAYLYADTRSFDRVYHGLDTRADALLIGCLLPLWPGKIDRVPRWLAYGAAVFIAVQALWASPHFDPFFGQMTAVSVAVAFQLLWLAQESTSSMHRWFSFTPLVWVGQISYSLYLWHVPVLMPIRQTVLPTYEKYPLYLLGSFLAASLSYYLIEMPFLKLKDRTSPSSNGPETTPQPEPQSSMILGPASWEDNQRATSNLEGPMS